MANKKRKISFLIIIVIILFIANPKTIQYLKAKTSPNKESLSVVKEIEIPHSSQIVYKKFDNGLIKYWEGILIYYNTKGEQKWSTNLAINRPVIKTNSNSIYIIDENKNQIMRINKKGEQTYKKTLNREYKNFNICNDNYAIIHHHSEDMIEYITVIDEEGKKVSEIALGEGNITNLAISKHYNKIAISTIGVSEDNLENKILIYDLDGNLISSENLNNNIILNIYFSEKGDLIVIDENNIFSINKDNKINWQTNFNDPITIVDTKNKNFITAYTKGNNNKSIIRSRTESTINLLLYSGKLLSEIKPDEHIENIDSYKNNIIAHSLRTIFKYDKNGELQIEYPYTSDILKSFILSDNNIVVITKEKISFLSLKGR